MVKKCGEHQRCAVVIVTGCALFVTSHCDGKFMFQIQRFGEVFDTVHMAIHALSLFVVV